jgi:co-chaperonin GroES (HSP10)
MIRPINDNLTIISEIEKEKTTESGIIITGSAVDDKSKPKVVIVAGVGPDVKSEIKVGDTILWSRQGLGAYGEVVIVPESSVLAIITT